MEVQPPQTPGQKKKAKKMLGWSSSSETDDNDDSKENRPVQNPDLPVVAEPQLLSRKVPKNKICPAFLKVRTINKDMTKRFREWLRYDTG